MDGTATCYEESELVFLLRQKDERSFSYLYDNYATGLYLVICRVVVDQHQAEDILQEVFVKIWSRIDQYNPDKGRIYTWMINIARNAAVDAMRSKSTLMKQRTCHVETATFNSVQPASTDRIGLNTLLSELCPRHQQLVEMAYFHGYTMVEISDALLIPVGTVKTHLRKAIAALRESFSYVPRTRIVLSQVA